VMVMAVGLLLVVAGSLEVFLRCVGPSQATQGRRLVRLWKGCRRDVLYSALIMRIGVVLLSLDVVGEDPRCPLPGVGGRFESVSEPEDRALFSVVRE